MHFLTLLSVVNAVYTFRRKRHYRLFEAPVEQVPSTPSAQRVRVDSTPMTSSPLRFIANMVASSSANSRSHPNAERDVWEIALWDPIPLCLRLFCYFSPGHVLVYLLFLPTLASDPRPSTTILTAIIIAILMSVQLSYLHTSFSQQTKDAALIHKEVLHEYDTKYVHPRTAPLMRDVGTQFSENESYKSGADRKYNTVDTFTPAHVINRGFKVSPNPNYVRHIDPDGGLTEDNQIQRSTPPPSRPTMPTQSSSQLFRTPSRYSNDSTPIRNQLQSQLIPNSIPHSQTQPLISQRNELRQPQFRPTSTSTSTGGDGGSLGIYTHANSPLRKSASTNFDNNNYFQRRGLSHSSSSRHLKDSASGSGFDSRQLSPMKRQSSPLKRSSVPGGARVGDVKTLDAARRYGHLERPESSVSRRESGRF